jgi:protein TonB
MELENTCISFYKSIAMTNKEILQAEMLDILFEHRNKTYGAYALRRDYNHRLRTALGIALSMVLFAILLSLFKLNNRGSNKPVNNEEPMILRHYEEEKIKPKEIEKPKDQTKQVQSTNKIIISSEETNMKTQEEIAVSNIGPEDIEGVEPEDPNRNQNINEANLGGGDKQAEKDEPEFKAGPTAHASFPGGESAWLNFLRCYLQTPDELEPGQRIEVRVRFWVDVDGSVSRFEIIQSGGSAFDKEVLRVMRKMPRWEPALQNGNKVPTSFAQPVIFIGVEE